MAEKPVETIGSGFSQNVKAQLKARENLFSSKNRTNDQLLYMNSNGAWARMVSSVNTLDSDEVIELAKVQVGPVCIEGDKSLAYNNVLIGGTRKQENNQKNTKLKGGINYTPNYTPIQVNEDLTISEGQLRENIYSNYKSLGYRPGPGIESISIESKNTYGTLREAKVKIVAWTLEDLEVIQALYMRPGYSMLLEWGHSLYIDNTGEISRENIPLYNGFLNNLKQTSLQIEKDLADKRVESQGNYDAMYGIVKNFNWSFRQDGGYDCEVTLISKGSVLESISIMFDPAETIDTDGSKEQDSNARKSPFHKFFQDLAKISDSTFTKDTLLDNTEPGNYTKLQDFYAIRLDIDTSYDLEDLEDRGQFISLRTLLDFYNNYASYIASNVEDVLDKGKTSLTKYYTGQGEEETGKYLKESKYITTKHHFSIDPMKCLFPTVFTAPEETGYTVGEYSKNYLKLNILAAIKEDLGKKIKKGEPDDILNIYVSNHQLSVIIEDLSNQKDISQHNMFTYMKNILDDMNTAAGGVNDFDQLYDESQDMWFIVDRKKTPTQEVIKNHAKLNLTGLSSTITDLSISSKISNEISAQVSIAAQGTGNNYKENVSTLLKWNSGLIDRTLPIKSLTEESYNENIKDEEKRQKAAKFKMAQWAWQVQKVFRQYTTAKDIFNNFWYGLIELNLDIDYDETAHDALKAGHATYCSRFVIDEYYKDKNDPKPPPGVIPVELSFTTIGIGGLKVGQAFTIADGILPKSYKDFGYIITGLSHSLENSKWKTSVKTQFYSIKAPTANEIPDKIDIPENTTNPEDPETPEGPISKDREWWTLVAICYAENYSGNSQGYADVAQSIYNRKRAGYYGGSIVRNILGAGQYEPVFNNKADWAKIEDIDTATIAVRNSLKGKGSNIGGEKVKSDLNKCAEGLQNSQYKQSAVEFVGTRTEFLASSPTSTQAIGTVERIPYSRNNSFFWRYKGKTELYDKNAVAIVYDFKPTDIA